MNKGEKKNKQKQKGQRRAETINIVNISFTGCTFLRMRILL
jgi:hypothetical protein